MHPSVMEYVRRAVTGHELAAHSALDVGSLNVNGSVRELFTGAFRGVDTREGPGVDEIADAEQLHFGDESFHTVVSTEMLEHCRRPWLAIAEMARVLERGGYLLLTARGYDDRGCFPVHEHPRDLWRLSKEGLRLLVEDQGLEVLDCRADPEWPGVLLTARKAPVVPDQASA
jgi:SAM-dependent methyltransferase